MMQTNSTTYMVWIAAMLLILASCGKDGPTGPIGPQGPQGEQGIRGEKGDDGSTIYSGSSAPSSSLGDIGDYYFRTSNSNFYGPKTAAGWGTPTNLRGATGATGATGPRGPTGPAGPAGAPGNRILSGTAAPTTSVGAVGDFYLMLTSNPRLYGPKTASGWPAAYINLRGATGATGPQGPPGTANVIYSDWFEAGPWGGTGSYRDIDLSVPEITAEIRDRGTILVYLKFNSGQTVRMLPTIYFGNTFWEFFSNSVGHLRIVARHLDGGTASVSPNDQFRYVIIPGGVPLSAALPGVELNDYGAVSVALGIRD